jgi:predicted solute-binding protein
METRYATESVKERLKQRQLYRNVSIFVHTKIIEFNIRELKKLLSFCSMLFNTKDVISLKLPLGGKRLRKEVMKNVKRLESLFF